MRYTKKKLAEEVDKIFGVYTEDEELNEFNIFHMYGDGKPCIFFNNGYVDSQNFNLVGYNTDLNKKRDLGRHDSFNPTPDCKLKMVRIFMDGSTMVKFSEKVTFDIPYQAMEVRPVNTN